MLRVYIKTDIFKLQLPIVTYGTTTPVALIYNRDRSVDFHLPITPGLLALFGEEFKIYAVCTVTHDEPHCTFQVHYITPDPGW